MKFKMILTVLAVAGGVLPCRVMAANEAVTSEDFEAYHTNTVYNSERLTVSYPGYADAVTSSAVIVNAPGGIYNGAEAYTANAAQNMIAYAKTGDTTALAVPGGLGNGWEGRYSHPVTGIDSTGGANASMNQYNRRCSVVNDGTGKALELCPDNNTYVNTFSLYAYDNVDFSKMTLWESDIKIKEIAPGGTASLSLTKGKMDQSQLFTYVSRPMGRTDITDILTFDSGGNILIEGNSAGSYQKDEYYRVSVLIDASGGDPVYSITVKNKADGELAAQLQTKELDYSFSGVTGIEYYANSAKNAPAPTQLLIDNIKVSAVIFSGQITSTRPVAINGNGVSMVVFDNSIDAATVSNDTIKVYNGETAVENVRISLNGQTQVRLDFPELEPSVEYKVVIDGVKSINGVTANNTVSFTTMDIVTVSNAEKKQDGAVYNIRNNAAYECSVTAMAVFYKNGKIVSDGVHYKKLTIPAGQTVSEKFTGMKATEPWDSIRLFFIDHITEGFWAAAPETVIQSIY